ncbi:MAG: hypothetical protein H6581_26055 [Bacteroidia bacterium]|nr:hypothetical protein [Bacteroidia bacterium]
MAEAKGLIHLKGTLRDLVFYRMNGKTIVRSKGTVSKERIMQDPAFARRRETMSEFGGANLMGRDMRSCWDEVKATFCGPYVSGRLCGKLKAGIAPFGAGEKGKRTLGLRNNPTALLGFGLDRRRDFRQICSEVFTLAADPSRRSVTLYMPPLTHADVQLRQPKGATHYRLWLHLCTISDYAWNAECESYQPLHTKQNLARALVISDPQPLREAGAAGQTITANLPVEGDLSEEVSMVALVGIEFCQYVREEYRTLAQNRAMMIAGIF